MRRGGAGEIGPLVDGFWAELEEDMVSTLSGTSTECTSREAYSPGAPTRPRTPAQTIVVRRRHGSFSLRSPQFVSHRDPAGDSFFFSSGRCLISKSTGTKWLKSKGERCVARV